jgi:hypothetical protein
VSDRELVTRKMVLITEDLRAVESLARKPVSEYVASPTDEVLAERYLERMIGRMIDIMNRRSWPMGYWTSWKTVPEDFVEPAPLPRGREPVDFDAD